MPFLEITLRPANFSISGQARSGAPSLNEAAEDLCPGPGFMAYLLFNHLASVFHQLLNPIVHPCDAN